jgi:hypothetical protein
MDACLPGTQQVSTDFDRSGPGRARTRHRRAGSQFSSDVSARCAALCPVLGCPRRACPGKCRCPAASCHACLTSDTPTSRLTLSQACLQSHQSSWQSRQSYQFRCRVRSWLRAPLFNSHRPHPGLIGATALAMYTAILTAPLAIKRDSARSCMHNVCIVRRATADTCMNRMNLACVLLPRGHATQGWPAGWHYGGGLRATNVTSCVDSGLA